MSEAQKKANEKKAADLEKAKKAADLEKRKKAKALAEKAKKGEVEFKIKNTGSRGVSLCEAGGMIEVPAFGNSESLELDETGVKSLTQNLKRFPQLSLVAADEADKEGS